jgi:hypothetical protein
VRIWAALAVVATVVAVLFAVRGLREGRRGEERAAADSPEPVLPDPARPAVSADSDPVVRTAELAGRTEAPVRGRLVYGDGAPAQAIELHLAVGRPLRTCIFRNGDYPAKTVWLVTAHHVTRTGSDGSFRFPATRAPRGGRRVLYTEPDEPAFVLQEWARGLSEVRAQRKVFVSGVLTNPAGEPLPGRWIGAQLGEPEDWHTRYSKEDDSFVASDRDLEVDPAARSHDHTDEKGRFKLRLVPGANTLMFGEWREDGTAPLRVPPHDLDLGIYRLRPKVVVEHARPSVVHGIVLDCAGRPHFGAQVRIWTGNVGRHKHEVVSDRQGRFRISGITAPSVILWAVSSTRPHLVLPSQSSGTVQTPCSAPILLRAPTAAEYTWMVRKELDGFFLFLREEVLLHVERLYGDEPLGMPPGRYRIVVVAGDGRILEASFALVGGAEIELGPLDFEDTTWH